MTTPILPMRDAKRAQRRRMLRIVLCGAVVAGGIAFWQARAHAVGDAGMAMALPAPTLDEPVGAASGETAIFAGGCFWGVQGVFQHVKGVTSAVSGYAGGSAGSAHYTIVSSGDTGHAESVEVVFDPSKVSYGTLLRIFFSVVHDPTELNRQGPDTGTQYRSAIFPVSPEQRRVAQAYIAQLTAAHSFSGPIVTRLEKNTGFYPAESYHQNFLIRHPRNPYIVVNDLPKVANLKRLFPSLYRADPVLAKN